MSVTDPVMAPRCCAVVWWRSRQDTRALPPRAGRGEIGRSLVIALPALWVYLAGSVKRAHDRGKSGWWLLLSLVPLVGAIWWLVDLGILEGEEGENRFGPDPRGTRAAA